MSTKTQSKVRLCTLGKQILKDARLYSGGHNAPPDMTKPCEECVNELASRLAVICNLHPNAKFTDNDPTVEPCIRKFSMAINDWAWITDAQRQQLKPFAVRLLFTRGSVALTRKRAFMCADWACRTIAPMALDLRKMDKQAAKLRALAPVVDKATAIQAGTECRAAYADAAAYAADAADAADAAAYAADAADAAAAASYAAAAADAADAAYAAYVRTQAKNALFKEALRFLSELIDATEPEVMP